MEKMWILIVLILNTWQDLKKKEVNLYLIGILFLYGVLKMIWTHDNWMEQSVSIAVGGMFIGLSILSKGGLGMGDGLLLLSLGIAMTLPVYLTFLGLALLLAALWSVFLLIFRKKNRNTEIPLVPFLLAGYIGSLALGL